MGDFPDKEFDRWVTRGPDEDYCTECGKELDECECVLPTIKKEEEKK